VEWLPQQMLVEQLSTLLEPMNANLVQLGEPNCQSK